MQLWATSRSMISTTRQIRCSAPMVRALWCRGSRCAAICMWTAAGARQKPARRRRRQAPQRRMAAYRATLEEDAELLKIFERTYGPIKRDPLAAFRPVQKTERPDFAAEQWEIAPEYLLVDGYNIIFAWDELNALAKKVGRRPPQADGYPVQLSGLPEMRASFWCSMPTACPAAPAPSSSTTISMWSTPKEAETADMFIERVTHEIGKGAAASVWRLRTVWSRSSFWPWCTARVCPDVPRGSAERGKADPCPCAGQA